MTKHNSNTLFRGHSMINGLVKDILADFQSVTWTEEYEELKQEIFDNIIEEGKCWYCGVGKIKDMDHFVPTNGRLFDPPMFGLEHEGNIIPSCKICNSNKSNKHPIEWLKKGRVTKGKEFDFPKERIESFELFFDLFKEKLIADEHLTDIILNQAIPRSEASTKDLSEFRDWIKL
tara:strand:+ start:1969 stop:2493 length:525 start_codon:yes stop_codon:yes gene_type:complete